jgi:hypothetical protein
VPKVRVFTRKEGVEEERRRLQNSSSIARWRRFFQFFFLRDV